MLDAFFFFVFGTVCFAGLVYVFAYFQARQQVREQTQRQKLALELSPTYQNWKDREHNRQLELEKFALVRQLVLSGLADGSNIRVNGTEIERFKSGRIEQVVEEPPIALPMASVRQPSMRSLMDELEPGSLSVCPGVRMDTGQPVILSIEDAVHFKLIGSSGFGKSCLAAALLEQAVTLNGPELLQIALLDLEHKTSRLFEDSPNVAVLPVGRRMVPMVAVNADEVAVYLGYLKQELNRRAKLSETELQNQPIMLVYVEEMLSLQYEVDEKLLAQMLADLSILAVRARKYRMFLLCCAQTDYSTQELKTAQKQFRTRIGFAIDVSAARAAGFMSTDLIKQNFTTSEKGGGQFVLESPGIASLMLAPVYDVRKKLLTMEQRSVSTSLQKRFTTGSLYVVKNPRNVIESNLKNYETPSQARFQEVAELRANGWGKVAIVEKVWNVKAGGSAAYKQACTEYEQIMSESEG